MPDVVRVGVQPPRVELAPGGASVVLEVTVFNGSAIIDVFNVEVIGTGEWLDAAPTTIRLFPDKEGVATLTLAIPPGRLVPAGERTVGIQVTSTSTPSLTAVERVSIVVAAVSAGVGLTLQPQVARGGASTTLTATLTNGGNAPLRMTMRGTDPEGAVTFAFNPEQVDVPPGGTAAVALRASAPRAFFGTERQRSLTVQAEGAGAPLSASATFVQAPRFTTGSLRALRTFLTLLAALALIGGAYATWVNEFTGTGLSAKEYANLAFSESLDTEGSGLSEGAVTFFTSAGFVAIFLGVLVLLGALTRSGKMTRVAGALALIFVLALFAVLYVSPDSAGTPAIGAGAILAAGGGILAIFGGSIGT